MKNAPRIAMRRHAAWTVACIVGLLQLNSQAGEQTVATAASSSSLLGQPRLFTASFSTPELTGNLSARRATSSGTDTDTQLWSAAPLLDARPDFEVASQRLILSFDSGLGGLPFRWYALPPTKQVLLDQGGAGTSRIDFLRGVRSQEGSGINARFRTRASRLGDIVNSNIWYVGAKLPRPTSAGTASTAISEPGPRTAMVYVGANDGMLHGFSAEDGAEKLAYVPEGLLPRLFLLSSADSRHEYFVDGASFAGDVRLEADGPAMTLLIGSLGAGGKGYFVLDVTDPAAFNASNAKALVRSDVTATTDTDIGQIFAAPVLDDADVNRSRQIVRMNNRRWAVVMGNGYFSAAEKPVLLIQYLDDLNRDRITGARELVKLSPCRDALPCSFMGGNGLSAPRLIDVNGDGMVDLAYAGDLQGNLWKFDLSGKNDAADPRSAWRVSFSNAPFFTGRSAGKLRQAITTAPHWIAHPRGGIMITIGTGRNNTDEDRASRGGDSIYALHDDSQIAIVRGVVTITDTLPVRATDEEPRGAGLVQQSYSAIITDGAVDYREASKQPVSYAGAGRKRGWYIDFPVAGQRVLHNPHAFEGQKILVQSTIPQPSAMGTGEKDVIPWTAGESFISIHNILTGHPPAVPVFEPVGSTIDVAGLSMARIESGSTLRFRQDGRTRLRFTSGRTVSLRNGVATGARAGWREYP